MSKSANYTIPISGLSDRSDGSFNIIKDAARLYYQLIRSNIGTFSKSGALLNSWKFELYNDRKASVYSNLPYARIRDKGGQIPITRRMKNFAWHMWYKTKNPMWKAIAITKKSYIIQKGKNYSDVDLLFIKQFIEAKYPIL
jgi:hypothetical protein